MRTYNFGKRHNGSASGGMFSREGESLPCETRFDFVAFLLSGKENAAEPQWFASLLDSDRYPDGSYEGYSAGTLANTKSAPDIHGTCYAILAMRSVGRTPPKEAVAYVERLKNDDGSFNIDPGGQYHSDMEATSWAALALCASGKNVPEESANYAKSLRNPDGSYGLSKSTGHGTLPRIRDALTVIKAAGAALSPTEKEETVNYIISRLGDAGIERRALEGSSDLDSCYDALVSLNILGHELSAEEKEAVLEQLLHQPRNSVEEKFKTLVAKKCLGVVPPEKKTRAPLPFPFRRMPGEPPLSLKEACHELLLSKLEAHP